MNTCKLVWICQCVCACVFNSAVFCIRVCDASFHVFVWGYMHICACALMCVNVNECICALWLVCVLVWLRVNVEVLYDSTFHVFVCGYTVCVCVCVCVSTFVYLLGRAGAPPRTPRPCNCHLHSKWATQWFRPVSTLCSVINKRSDVAYVWLWCTAASFYQLSFCYFHSVIKIIIFSQEMVTEHGGCFGKNCSATYLSKSWGYSYSFWPLGLFKDNFFEQRKSRILFFVSVTNARLEDGYQFSSSCVQYMFSRALHHDCRQGEPV